MDDQQQYPCIELLAELFHLFEKRVPHFNLHRFPEISLLAPQPFITLFAMEMKQVSRETPHFKGSRTIHLRHLVEIQESTDGRFLINGIKMLPNYEMALVLYHNHCVSYTGPNPLLVKIPFVPGFSFKHETGDGVEFNMIKLFDRMKIAGDNPLFN